MEKIKMMNNKSGITLNDAYTNFLRKCKIKNLSEATIYGYKEKLKLFLDYADKIPLTQFNTHTVDNYVVYLREHTGCNDISVNTYLRTLRAFLYSGMDCNYMPRFKVSLIKADKPLKETYTDDELSRLLEKPDTNKCNFHEYKIWVFENFLLGTGVRLSTALNIKVNDIDFENGLIRLCKTKNRRQTMIPLSNTLASILTEYMTIRGGNEEDLLFCNEYGQPASARSYQLAVSRFNRRRNVNRTSIHAFRHTFATKYILAGGSVETLCRIMGHSSITITMQYVDLVATDLTPNFERFNPLDQMAKKLKGVN